MYVIRSLGTCPPTSPVSYIRVCVLTDGADSYLTGEDATHSNDDEDVEDG